MHTPRSAALAPTAKYEFVDGDTVTTWDGRTLHRIRALVAIAATLMTPAVEPGELGGYVESAAHLAQDGNAWVSGNAWVYGNAQVSGNAWVYGDAQVSGNAWVSGNAQVSGNAWVSGDARVSGNAQVSGNAWVYGDALIVWFSHVGSENGTLTVYNAAGNTLHVTRGCFAGTVEEFLAASAARHDERIQREYRMLIDVAVSRIEAGRATTPVPAPESVPESQAATADVEVQS